MSRNRRGRNKGQTGRAYLKRFSAGAVNAGQGIDRRYTDQFKAATRSMGQIRQPKDIMFHGDGVPILPRVFHHEMVVPHTKPHYDEHGVRRAGISPARKAVVERMHDIWKDEEERGHRMLPRIRVYNGQITKTVIWMYYSSSNRRYIFVEETSRSYRCSIDYSSRERAMLAFQDHKITWIEYQERNTEAARTPQLG